MTRRPFNPLHIPRAAQENELYLHEVWRIWKHDAKEWLGIPYRTWALEFDKEGDAHRKRLIWNWRDKEIWRAKRTTLWFTPKDPDE